MVGIALSWVTDAWQWLVDFIELSPGHVFASLVLICTLMFCATVIGFAARLRSLQNRNRQLARCIDSLSHAIERMQTEFDSRFAALSVAERGAEPRPNGRAPAQDPAAAQIREELAAIRLELHTANAAEETPAAGPVE